MRHLRTLVWILAIAGLGGAAAGVYFTHERWLPFLRQASPDEPPSEPAARALAAGPSEQVLLTEQAQKNLRLTAKPLKAQTFWKSITIPGMIVDRPGHSDRGVVSPVAGIVSLIHHFPGDTVNPGESLFTVRLLSESLHLTQTELFKATQDIRLALEQKKRLEASAGAVPEARVIEVENQLARLQVAVKAYRQDLFNRGLSIAQINSATEGQFVPEITIHAPPRPPLSGSLFAKPGARAGAAPAFEVQELRVELGQQVQAGQTLCLLANHQMLAIEGRAFREETPLLERSVRENWKVEVDFQEDKSAGWPKLEQPFTIRYLSNSIDPTTRTFAFLIPIENQSRVIEQDGRIIVLWRFRPGHPVRLQLPVEKLENVFVLPTDAIVREGGEAYVFRQNGDVFDRKPVHVVYQDRQYVIIANDGSVPAGIFVAQAGAAQLNRMIKSQSGAMPKGFHIHADGSVHMGSH